MNCWIEIDRSKICDNYRAIQELIGEDIRIIAVVKANAYGHGAPRVAVALQEFGATNFAVTTLEEALALRDDGVNVDILLMAPALADEVEELVRNDITACISCMDDARALSETADRLGLAARGHLKIDTGMGRLGVAPVHALEIASECAKLPAFKLEGAFTHFANASDPDVTPTHHQFNNFHTLFAHLHRMVGMEPDNFHCCNSAALVRFHSMRLSCVRPGTLLYGQFPSTFIAEIGERAGLHLKDPFTVKARVRAIQLIPQGGAVGYGSEWRAPKASRIATLAVGYADGLTMEPHARTESLATATRQLRSQLARTAGKRPPDASRRVKIRGQEAQIIGRIAMQQCSVDVTHIPEVVVGDEVTLFMRRLAAAGHLKRVYVG